ncbi:hypothetical protein CBZ_05120 [Cellulomonas biazotea]|nr:hypothetical protein CBZ_05120 [Cellulomonas biazotea]
MGDARGWVRRRLLRRAPVLTGGSAHTPDIPIPGSGKTRGSERRSTTMAKAVVRKPKKKQNPLKAAKIESVDYKDTALLRKFISDRGKIRARRVTGVSVQEQRAIARAVKNAREMALLPYSSSAR